MIVYRRVDTAQIEQVKEILYSYLLETAYSKLEYDAAASHEYILEWLTNNYNVAALDGEKFVGFASMALGRTFYKDIEADVVMFMVDKDYRGKGVGRGLSQHLVKVADENNAKAMYSPCFSGISEKNNSLFVNLWKKHGFEVLGTVMIRS